MNIIKSYLGYNIRAMGPGSWWVYNQAGQVVAKAASLVEAKEMVEQIIAEQQS